MSVRPVTRYADAMDQHVSARLLHVRTERHRELRGITPGGEPYEHYPLGEYIVAAPGVCGGRPTFKYTRPEVSVTLAQLAAGESAQELVEDYAHSGLTPAAIEEAAHLASEALTRSAKVLQPAV